MRHVNAESSEDRLLHPVAEAERDAAKQRLFDFAIWLGLIACILVVYAQVGDFEFENFDTNLYVYGNPHVAQGLTAGTIRWAFTAVVAGNWMPVTLLSHALDVQLFGMQSGIHHLVNVLFHALAAILLFACLKRATGARGPSAFVAFVFAIHPLHVESVAWIAERKDVLAAFFWFLALYCYLRYAEKPSTVRYLALAAAFSLGLMSKPTSVTFPFTLLLFDVWPLRRYPCPKGEALNLIWEKVPLFLLSAMASIVTYKVQGSAGALAAVAPASRIANAFTSCLIYLRQTFWPADLAVFYPYPHSYVIVFLTGAVVVTAGMLALAISAWRTRPHLTVGLLWFFGTLIPVIGLVQAGRQAHADRYMYVPMVGMLIVLAWGAADVYARSRRMRHLISVAATAFCIVCLVVARRDVAYWQNSGTLFQRALDVTRGNVAAEEHLAAYDLETGRLPAAVEHYESALAIDPTYAPAEANLGVALKKLEGCATAERHFEAAIHLNPNYAAPRFNLGLCRSEDRDYAGAAADFESAVQIQPVYPDARLQLSLALAKIPGRTPDAIRELEEALQLEPEDAKLHAELGLLLASIGRGEEAMQQLKTALDLDPLSNPEIELTLDRLRLQQQKLHQSDDR